MGKVSSVSRLGLLRGSQISDLAAGQAMAGDDMPSRSVLQRKANSLTCWPLQAGDLDRAYVYTLLLQPQTTCIGQGPHFV